MLDVRDVSLRLGDRVVLDHVSLHVARGEIVALLGPSGSGKSTLLKVIAGILAPDEGSIELDGRNLTDVPTHRRGIGMVFQDHQLFPHLDVAANIGFGLRMQGLRRTAVRDRVDEMLELVGLAGFGHRHVDDLSGGEVTRVALARSLAPRPQVLLLDEPLTGLDRELHDRLLVDLHALLAGVTTILVTHDADEAAAVAERTLDIADLAARPTGEVVELRADETHPLRLSVLRRGTPTTDVTFAEDTWPGVVHLGVRVGGDLVATSTWIPRPLDGVPAVQLRGMATANGLQGRGIGGTLVEAGCARAATTDAELVWARARDAALAFYMRHGFVVRGDGFVDDVTGLPHHLVVRPIARR